MWCVLSSVLFPLSCEGFLSVGPCCLCGITLWMQRMLCLMGVLLLSPCTWNRYNNTLNYCHFCSRLNVQEVQVLGGTVIINNNNKNNTFFFSIGGTCKFVCWGIECYYSRLREQAVWCVVTWSGSVLLRVVIYIQLPQTKCGLYIEVKGTDRFCS
jgi:hypothetical protein